MEIFPFIFGRVGGCSIETLDSLKSQVAETYIKRFFDLQREIEDRRSSLIDELYLLINDESDEKIRNALLNFKRDIFNKRRKAIKAFEKLKFRDNIELKVRDYFKSQDQQENLIIRFNTLFFSEEENNIKIIDELKNQSFLTNGLIFSSHTLIHELKKCALSNFDKLNSRVITTLLKYLTRSITKTTPYSSFNDIFFLHRISGIFNSNVNVKASNIQVSNLFYYHLKDYLLYNSAFRNVLSVRINSTIWITDESIGSLFFFQNDRNNESFKKIKSSSTLLSVIDLLTNTEMTYEGLISDLQKLSSDSKESVELFVNTLIKEGLVKIIFPVACAEKEWLLSLIDFLNKKQRGKEFQEIRILLNSITETISFMEDCLDSNLRYSAILDCHRSISDFFKSNDPSSEFISKVGTQDLFYEDCFTNSKEIIAENSIRELLMQVKEVYIGFNTVQIKPLMRSWMAKLFAQSNVQKLPVLQFYEKFCLANYKDSDFLKEELKSTEELIFVIIKRIQELQENSSVDISDLVNRKNEPDLATAFGIYIQSEDEEFKNVVINSFFSGYGANVTRFLNSLPEKYSSEFIAYNHKLFPEKIIVEVKDASIHNINTFPKIADKLIDICDERISNSTYELISLANIFVTMNEAKELILIDTNNVELKVFNFSLEDINRRSAFYRFIDTFNDTDLFGLNYLMMSITKHFEAESENKKIIHIPRLTFKGRIILHRERWLVSTLMLMDIVNSRRERGENFLRLNSFIIKNGIPEEAFIRFVKRNPGNSKDDRYKPQYFNFKFPIFITLFMEQLNKADSVIEISEMFPTSNGVRNTGGKVKEYIFNCS